MRHDLVTDVTRRFIRPRHGIDSARTTRVLSSGVAETMAANRSGVQWSTVQRLAMAWMLTVLVGAPVLAVPDADAGIGRRIYMRRRRCLWFFVTRDGQRFIVVTVLDVTQSPPINVVTDWQSQLPR